MRVRRLMAAPVMVLTLALGACHDSPAGFDLDEHRIDHITKSKIRAGGVLEVREGDVRQVLPFNKRGEFAGGECEIINPKDKHGRTIEVATLVGSSRTDCNVRGVTSSSANARLIVKNAATKKFEVQVSVQPDHPCYSKCVPGKSKSTYVLATD